MRIVRSYTSDGDPTGVEAKIKGSNVPDRLIAKVATKTNLPDFYITVEAPGGKVLRKVHIESFEGKEQLWDE